MKLARRILKHHVRVQSCTIIRLQQWKLQGSCCLVRACLGFADQAPCVQTGGKALPLHAALLHRPFSQPLGVSEGSRFKSGLKLGLARCCDTLSMLMPLACFCPSECPEVKEIAYLQLQKLSAQFYGAVAAITCLALCASACRLRCEGQECCLFICL